MRRAPPRPGQPVHGAWRALAAASVVLLGACASSAGIETRAQRVSAEQVGLSPEPAPGQAVALPSLEATWWRGFGDEGLSRLIERALADHPSLRVAQARLARAGAALAGVRANEGVQVNASADTTRQHFSATSIYPPPLGGSTRTLATAQLSASWEFDFFGRNHAAVEAAAGAEQAARADMLAARNLLASQVARSSVQLGRLQAQRQVASDLLKQREAILALIRQRVRSGLDTLVELRQGEGALPEARQQIEQLDEQIMLTRHALAAFTAQPPQATHDLVVPLDSLQAIDLPASLPADLLARRADVTAARWRVEAAAGELRSAKAQFYPNVNLVAFAGFSSLGLNRLLESGSQQYGVGPALRLPLFDSGRLRANLRGKSADMDAAVESYNGAVIDAVHDVVDQVASLQALSRQQAEQVQAQAAAASAHDLALQRFRAGLSTYTTVLLTESSLLNQRRLAIDLKARTVDTQIHLARALGGGFRADDQLAAQAGR